MTGGRPREVLAVVPARGGSKGMAGKNLRLLGGRPLLAWSCDAARGSSRVTRAVLSTDDPEIAEAGGACGIEVPFLRPSALAADETPMLDVLRHVVEELRAREQYAPDALVLLQPTSPLRTSAHVDAAVDELLVTGADSVVTVVEVPHQFNPVSVMRVEHGRLVPVLGAVPPPGRRQDKPRVFARNGPAVLAVRTDIVRGGALYGADSRPLLMTHEESIDIDTELDLELAAWLLERREKRT